jgi:hypothetical protein
LASQRGGAAAGAPAGASNGLGGVEFGDLGAAKVIKTRQMISGLSLPGIRTSQNELCWKLVTMRSKAGSGLIAAPLLD